MEFEKGQLAVTIDGHVDNASDYPVINWLNQLNTSVIEGYMRKTLRRSEEAETWWLLISTYGASKEVIFGSLGYRCHHKNKFVKEYVRFSEVIVPYVSL